MEKEYKIIQGNCIDTLKTLPDKSVQCCITSPPYYGLRDYGTGKWIGGDPNCPHRRLSKYSPNDITGHKAMGEQGEAVGDAIYKSVCPLCGAVRVDEQIGLEETPEEYISRLVDVFREVKRVLKDDGTLWVNIGDSYNGYKGNAYSEYADSKFVGGDKTHPTRESKHGLEDKSLKPKDLIGIPWMLAFALRNDGWYLRQDIIWCLSGGEYIYVKSKKGVMPIMVREIDRLKTDDIKLWNGKSWVGIKNFRKSTLYNSKVKITLRSGERINCTDGHRWVLKDGTEKSASELKVGDILKTVNLPDEFMHTPGFLTDDVLWFLGLYLAEGSKSDDCIQIALNADEFKWYDRIDRVAKYLGGTSTYTIDGNKLSIRIFSQILCSVLHQYIGGKTAINKHLKNICWNMPNRFLKSIIIGYFDGDGHYDPDNNRIRLGFTRNYYLERDLRILANRLGATITLNPSVSYIKNSPYKSFNGEWRWERSGHFNEKDRSEIVSISSGNSRNFYDIEVDSSDHTFALASGVITHNCKPNPMPESVKDRCTKSHEYIFLFSKQQTYYFDYEAIQEPASGYDGRNDTMHKGSPKYAGKEIMPGMNEQSLASGSHERWKFVDGVPIRNKRDVWSVNVSGYSEAHFATFPTKLVEPCVLAGTKQGDTVLDPFSGSGTTGVVSMNYGRKYIGCELNEEYIKLSEDRFSKEVYHEDKIVVDGEKTTVTKEELF